MPVALDLRAHSAFQLDTCETIFDRADPAHELNEEIIILQECRHQHCRCDALSAPPKAENQLRLPSRLGQDNCCNHQTQCQLRTAGRSHCLNSNLNGMLCVAEAAITRDPRGTSLCPHARFVWCRLAHLRRWWSLGELWCTLVQLLEISDNLVWNDGLPGFLLVEDLWDHLLRDWTTGGTTLRVSRALSRRPVSREPRETRPARHPVR